MQLLTTTTNLILFITTSGALKTEINILYVYTKVCLQFAKGTQLNNADGLNKTTITG